MCLVFFNEVNKCRNFFWLGDMLMVGNLVFWFVFNILLRIGLGCISLLFI